MRRYSQNNDNRYYAFLPPASTRSSRNTSTNSSNRNAHYQYYDPRLRTQLNAQQALYEYQYSNRNLHRSLPSLHGSAHYQPPSFLEELPPSSTNSVSDLGEPISVFDDIQPLEYRRSITTPSLASSYVPSEPGRRPSVSDVRLATAHVLREHLVADIERSITDIDRELTSLERRPSGPRYLPSRFSPIIESEPQDDNLLRQLTITTTLAIKPASVSAKKTIPIITSPVHKQIQQTSAHSTTTTRDRSNAGSQLWPNKPKRIYEVIPSLTGDSRKTSRQSSVGGQHEHIKISEIQSPPSPTKTIEKQMSITSIQYRGQYHYGPEVEEVEILSNDPENSDHQSIYDEMRERSFHEPMNTNELLRDSSAAPHSRALIFVPEYGGQSQMENHESAEDLIHTDQFDTNVARSLTASSLHGLTSAKDLIIRDTESLVQIAPEHRIEPEVTTRIPSRSTITPEELYHKTETTLINDSDPIISDDIKQSRPGTTTPIMTEDPPEKSSPLHPATDESTAIVPLPSPAPPADNNVSGLVAYFFSDFGNEGEGEEDMPIDQSNFTVPTGAEIIADDDISNSLMGQSQASLLILHSAHMPRQQHTSTMPLTIENNNERMKVEEKEEIGSKETDVTKKRISTTTSILPSPPSPPKQVLPASITDNMQTQFTKNNNSNNDDHHRRPSITHWNINIGLSNIADEVKRSSKSPIRHRTSSSPKTSRIHSRVQSTTSNRNDEPIEKSIEETPNVLARTYTPLKTIDNKRIPTSERIDSADQRIKSSTRTLSRAPSTASDHTEKNEEITPIDSPTRTSLKNIDRENSSRRRSTPRQPSVTPSEQPPSNRRRSTPHRASVTPGEQPLSSRRRTTSRQPSITPSERPLSNRQRTTSRQPSVTPSEQYHSSRRQSPSLRPSSSENHGAPQSTDILLRGQSYTSIDDPQKTPINENEPQTFSVENEHFLRNKSEASLYNLNQRLPSDFTMSHPHDDSRRSSTASSTIPVLLNSPDNEDNQRPTSRAATPMRKTSISSMDLPPDPNALLTTTDEPDPDDASRINSTIHFQMLSSQPSNSDTFVPNRDEPSPLMNIAPIQEFPSRVQSVELPSELLPTEEQFHEPSSIMRYSPTNEIELEPNDETRPASAESDVRLPSASSSHHEQERPVHQTPSLSKNGHQQESSRHSPLLSYPARLEDLMRPTPSPFHSAHEHKPQENDEHEQNQNNRILSVSPAVNETETHRHHHAIHQNIPSKFKQNDIHSPSNSPRHSQLSDTNHTSIEGDDTYQQKLDTPSISPQNEVAVSPDHDDYIDYGNNTNHIDDISNHHHTQKQTLKSPPIEPTFITQHQPRPLSEKSASSIHSDHRRKHDQNLHRNDLHLSSASMKLTKHHKHSSPPRPASNEKDLPVMTASQQHSKLSLRLKRKKSTNNERLPSSSSLSPLPQIDTAERTSINNDENHSEEKTKQRRQRRRVSFSSSIAHFQMEERQLYTNWRERVAAILASKHRPNEKYAHIQSRVNSFANFEYQPKKIKIIPKKKPRPKTNEQSNLEQNKFIKRKKSKVKKSKIRQETDIDEQTDDDQHQTQPVKGPVPQLFGRLWCLPDGSPTVFHESLEWNASSKLKAYSYENLNYEPHRNEFKIFNKKPRWHSESKLTELLREPPRFFHRQTLVPPDSLPIIPDPDEPYFYEQQPHQEAGTERKIFDIQTNIQRQTKRRIQTDNISHDSRPSDVPIFDEKLVWTGRSKLKDTTWQNANYQPKKSKVQIFHKTVHWNSEPKIRTRSPSTVHASRASMSNVQIFDQKLNWDAEAKVHCWSEIDLRQLTKKKSIFAQYHDPKWNDVVTARVDTTNYHYPKLPNNVEIFSDRLSWTRSSGLKNYVWENFDYKSHRRTRQSNNRQHLQDTEQTPPNRPKWNAVSKTRSVNSVYNPKVTNSNTIRRGWDRDLRRKRVHKLPPLKRKREREEIPQLAIDAPPSNGQLAIDYNYDHASTTQGRTNSNDYATTSSRRSSKALVPLNHNRRFSELELPVDTPRSQRPVQQEWYEEMNKSRLTHRTDMGRTTNHSYRTSIDSLHQPHTPRELATFRSSTRNSQNSLMSEALLDSSVRTNRTTEFRLSKDMDEHHHHSHTPNQSMPIEIRGFKLEGTQLTVPDHATIRPLSNVSYGASERVKSRRVYPWSSLHPHGTSSRNSSLVPIAEFRRPSLDTTITESQPLIHEE